MRSRMRCQDVTGFHTGLAHLSTHCRISADSLYCCPYVMYRETRHIISGLGAGSYYLHTSYAMWSTYYFPCLCICLSAQKLQNYQIKIDATWTWHKYVLWWLLGEVVRLWSHFALAFELWPSCIFDKKIGYNFKTTGQIVEHVASPSTAVRQSQTV